MTEVSKHSLFEQGKSSKFLVIFIISFALAKLFGVAFTKIFTNVLTRDEMGQYTLIISAAALIMTFAAFGFPSALNRYTIRYKTKGKTQEIRDLIFTGTVIFILIEFLIVATLLVLYLTSDIMPWFLELESYIAALSLIAIIVLAQIFSTICFTVATSLQNSRHYAIVVIMRVLLQIPFGILFVIFLDLGVFGLIAGLAVTEFIVALYSVYKIVKDIGIGRFSIKELKKITKYSLPPYFAGILFYVFDLAILLFIDFTDPTTGTTTIALYRFGALTVVNLILIAGNVFRMVYRPVIYKNFERDRFKEMERLTVQISKIFIIVFIPIALILFAFSPLLISFFTKDIYLPSISAIPLLLLSVFFQYLQSIVTYGHGLYFKNYWNGIVGVISFIAAVVVAYFTIPINPLVGISLAYLTRRGLYFIGLFFVSQRYFKVKYDLKVLFSILLISAISIGLGVIFYFWVFSFLGYETNIVISFSISTVLFFILVFVSKLVTRKDINFLTDIFKDYTKGFKQSRNRNT